jgi:uncharacterized membrane protein YbaN (DUF454 family)
MNARVKRIVIWWLGWAFILLGIAGLVLPILQGILFLLIGLSLLSNQSAWAARLLHKLKERFPRISEKLSEATAKARDVQLNLFKRKPKPSQLD